MGSTDQYYFPSVIGDETGTELSLSGMWTGARLSGAKWSGARWSGSTPHVITHGTTLPLPCCLFIWEQSLELPEAPDGHTDTHLHTPCSRQSGQSTSQYDYLGTRPCRQNYRSWPGDAGIGLHVILPCGPIQGLPQPQQNHAAESSGPLGKGWPTGRSWRQERLPSLAGREHMGRSAVGRDPGALRRQFLCHHSTCVCVS